MKLLPLDVLKIVAFYSKNTSSLRLVDRKLNALVINILQDATKEIGRAFPLLATHYSTFPPLEKFKKMIIELNKKSFTLKWRMEINNIDDALACYKTLITDIKQFEKLELIKFVTHVLKIKLNKEINFDIFWANVKKTQFLKGITKLEFSYHSSSYIPDFIDDMNSLKTLKIWWTNRVNFPPSLSRITTLTHLRITGCHPPQLSEAAVWLSNLRGLKLHMNELTDLPQYYKDCRLLKKLSLQENKLTKFPPLISAFTQLEKLTLSIEKISILPPFITLLTRLQELNLYSNNLSELPQGMSALIYLDALDLSFNKFKGVPEELKNMNLASLNLESNKISSVPDWVFGLKKLVYLNISNNPAVGEPEPSNRSSRLFIKRANNL